MKYNCCIFETLFKIKANGISLFGISCFPLKIFTFLYFPNKGIFLEIFFIQCFTV